MMLTIDEVIKKLNDAIDRATLEHYIAHAWIKPIAKHETWHFEEIDIARVQLVHNLHRDMLVNEDAMDIVLSLLDQVYGHREKMRLLRKAIEQQPRSIQQEIFAILDNENQTTTPE